MSGRDLVEEGSAPLAENFSGMTTPNGPLAVSVVVPVYNGEDVLADCLESLVAQEEPEGGYEVLVVDNNSTDGTCRLVQRYPVHYVSETHRQTSYAARNAGVRAARGDVIAFTDADCVASRDWLRNGIAYFDNDRIGCVAGEIEAGTPRTKVERLLAERKWLSQQQTLNHPFLPYAVTANAFYRREVFQQVGLFDEDLLSGGDADFGWRMLRHTKFELTYGRGALVRHRHRSDLRSLFRQSQKWGYGTAMLQQRYGPNAARSSAPRYQQIARLSLRFVRGYVQSRLRGREYAEGDEILLNWMILTGFEIGKLRGKVGSRSQILRPHHDS